MCIDAGHQRFDNTFDTVQAYFPTELLSSEGDNIMRIAGKY